MQVRAVILFFKYPEPGKVKTRLCKKFTPASVAKLYEMFIYDTCCKLSQMQNTDIFAFAANESEQESAVQAFFAKKKIPILMQVGEGLGERMSNAFQMLFEKAYRQVVILGTDSPDLPLAYIESAFGFLGLAQPGICVAPSEDGGYYLLGMNAFFPTLFQEITYSTSQVYIDTLKKALQLPASFAALRRWYDIDEPEDLARLKKNASSPLLSHTKMALEKLQPA
ncbi:uncharacterized protein-like protein [Chloroherpeton thalassium ATCC 35110]|uniref:Uncharacterized protein-like protein n=1 Tax=Chloroherpeton thalassium (strain ATCC 35110 / GB-78) TaxID=517418 RepID=B3QYL9_CHLT3|nr:TIGR04282 family arsenosugar biosynthesis glycosyltransferase [Chloroherpeton thalassium]ACF13647.1 uncharacterized protein-like protein [Chloroherpeton thalassium ATCC 35110]